MNDNGLHALWISSTSLTFKVKILSLFLEILWYFFKKSYEMSSKFSLIVFIYTFERPIDNVRAHKQDVAINLQGTTYIIILNQ